VGRDLQPCLDKGDIRNLDADAAGGGARSRVVAGREVRSAYSRRRRANTTSRSAPERAGRGEKRSSLGNPPSFFYSPQWSPAAEIAYTDKRLNLWVCGPVAKGCTGEGGCRLLRGALSTCGGAGGQRWLGVHQAAASFPGMSSGCIARAGKSFPGHRWDERRAVRDLRPEAAKYLTSPPSTDVGPSAGGFDMSSQTTRPQTRSVYAVGAGEGQGSPLAPRATRKRAPSRSRTRRTRPRRTRFPPP